MDSPSISVILPAFNCASYIESAVQSILRQTYTDFELLVMDDGSSDETASIVSSIKDSRIRLVQNDRNRGLVYTLNHGLNLAQGTYIARMDGDDLARPDRFELQVRFLEAHPGIGVVGSTAELINANGEITGVWDDDVRHLSERAISRFLPHNNCIVHPSVMARSIIFKTYKYKSRQKQAEDYDLWLRLRADGIRIAKLEPALLQHRIVAGSFTRNRQQNVFFKNARTKLVFAGMAIGRSRLNGFVLKTMLLGTIDLVKGVGKEFKTRILGN